MSAETACTDFEGPVFRDLLQDQIAAARDAAAANDLIGQDDLADWWRWRAEDLSRYLDDTGDHDDAFELDAA